MNYTAKDQLSEYLQMVYNEVVSVYWTYSNTVETVSFPFRCIEEYF